MLQNESLWAIPKSSPKHLLRDVFPPGALSHCTGLPQLKFVMERHRTSLVPSARHPDELSDRVADSGEAMASEANKGLCC